MYTLLENKVALVTGSSGGIGRAIASRLARDGAAVAAHYHSNETAATDLVAQLEDEGHEAAAFQADVSDVQQIEQLFDAVVDRFGPLDIFVANAGLPAQKPVTEVSEEDYDRVFSVNTRGVFFCLQAAAQRVTDGGRIIDISSGQTIHPAKGFAVYAGSKAAPERFVSVLAQELGERHVTVNSIVAGPIDAGFFDEAPEEYKERMADISAMGRLGQPEDVADATALLASERARWITGHELVVYGGATHF